MVVKPVLGSACSGKSKGFIFTVDVLMSLVIITTFFLIAKPAYFSGEDSLTRLQLKQSSSDMFTVLDENGFFLETLDANMTPNQKMALLENKFLSVMPQSQTRVELKSYDMNILACRQNKTYSNCFGNENVYPVQGSALPSDRDIVHERKIFIKKLPPGACQIQPADLHLQENGFSWPPLAFNTLNDDPLILNFSAPENDVWRLAGKQPRTIYFAPDINIDLNVSIVPDVSEVKCDDEITVNLSATIPPQLRLPIDMMLVLDKSGSMGSCTYTEGPYIKQSSGSIGGSSWQLIDSFDINSATDFSVFMDWSSTCFFSCPHMFIRSPSDVNYGYGYTSDTGLNCYDDQANYDPTNSYIEMIMPLALSETGTWRVYAYKSGSSYNYTLDVQELSNLRSKFEAMQNTSIEFLYNAEWTALDQIGYVSFSYDHLTFLETPLTFDRNQVRDDILATTYGGGTAIGEGIYVARDELLSVRARSNGFKVQVLLSDGQNTDGPDPITAANNAAANNITIYTIGFGLDADETTLQNIADITGGSYHFADDENSLQDIYDVIATEVDEAARFNEAYDANVLVPLPPGVTILDPGNGSIQAIGDDNFLAFNIGYMDDNSPWADSYVITFPCNNDYSCTLTEVSFPDMNTAFYYNDVNGVFQPPIFWDQHAVASFSYRDLAVTYLQGEVAGIQLFLDTNVANVGQLDANASLVEFFLHDLNGAPANSRVVDALCSPLTPGCLVSYEVFLDVPVNGQGDVYAVVNRSGNIRECPGNNIAKIQCTFGGILQYYVLDYWMWLS